MKSGTTTPLGSRQTGKTRRRGLTCMTSALAISAMMLGSVATANAQDVEAEDEVATLDTVTVTAKNRVQNVQDVPLSISVLSQEDLVDKSIFDVRDLAQFTPSFNFVSGAGRNDATALSIRGLAPNTSDERFQGVTFFVDGIALSGQLTGIDLTQLSGVEVIRGPQSALFGRATYSGAVNYQTRNPVTDRLTGTFRARIAGTDEQDFSTDTDLSYLVSGRVDFPIIPGKLWGSVNASQLVNGAIAESPSNGLNIGEEETFAVGGVLYAEPTSNWSLKFRAAYDNDDDSQPFSLTLSQRDAVNAGLPLIPAPRNPATLFPSISPDPIIGLTAADANFLFGEAGVEFEPGDIGTQRDRLFLTLLSDYTLNNGMTLSYKGGYFNSERDQLASFTNNRDSTPAPNNSDPIVGDLINDGTLSPSGFVAGFRFGEEFENTSHQLLALSPDSGRFRWQAGLYFFKEQSRNNQPRFTSDANPDALSRGTDEIENFAVFGQIEYDVTDRLTASFEGRWQTEDVSLKECIFCNDATNQDFVDTTRDFLPRATLDYQATDNTLVYALYSEGVKSARFSTPQGDDGNGFGAPILADQENLQNYEIGLKNTFIDGRVIANFAAFYSDIENQQLVSVLENITLPNGQAISSAAVPVNVGESRIWGLEFEGGFDVTESFNISGNVGYANQEFTNDDPFFLQANNAFTLPATDAIVGVGNQNGILTDDPVILDGLQQANVPRVTASISGSYDYELRNGDNLNFRIDTNYRGKFFANLGNITEVRDAWNVNLRASYQMDYGTVSFFVRNLTNNDRSTVGNLAGGTSACPFNEVDAVTFGSQVGDRCLASSRSRPRTIGVELTANF